MLEFIDYYNGEIDRWGNRESGNKDIYCVKLVFMGKRELGLGLWDDNFLNFKWNI